MDKTGVYTERIHRVVDFIEANLAHDITLDDLARTAGFSKYHFHRIFCYQVEKIAEKQDSSRRYA
ncbi:MAG: AraC family transcriptional regulator [Spirochaeta sp.]